MIHLENIKGKKGGRWVGEKQEGKTKKGKEERKKGRQRQNMEVEKNPLYHSCYSRIRDFSNSSLKWKHFQLPLRYWNASISIQQHRPWSLCLEAIFEFSLVFLIWD